jgi:ABC-2 type transport system ATP-binding protein
MIVVSDLSKSYGGPAFAVRDVSFRVEKGEVVGFLGPNGAGKSTTLRVVAGFLGATAGRVTLGGHDLVDEPMRARELVGYMPESVPLYPEMRVVEYLRFRAEIKRVARRKRHKAIEMAMEKAKVEDMSETLIGHLSKGYRQRVGLADALVADPPILILDEPTSGLDPNQIREVRALVRDLGKEHAVLFSTHILSEVEATCDRAVVIAKGSLVAEGTIDHLRKMRRSRSVRIVARSGDAPAGEKAASLLRGIAAVGKVREEGEAVVVTWREGTDDVGPATEELAQKLMAAGFRLRELAPVTASLEEVFAELTLEPAEARG